MNTSKETQNPADPKTSNKFYLATWRWHFYSGVFVIPFIIMLSLTGLVMVFHNQLDGWQFKNVLFVEPGEKTVTAEAQLEAVRNAYPEAEVSELIPPRGANRSTQISITTSEGKDLLVGVNPYTGEILEDVDPTKSSNYIANDIHGTFLLGTAGDRLIEIAAGLAILLIITGLYLWSPRNKQGIYGTLWPRFRSGKRILWRDLHSSLGFYLSLGMVFFMISGLAWTGFWGGQMTQAWSTFPAEKWDNVPLSDQTHASLNTGALEEVPWGLEQTPLPASGSMAGVEGIPEGLPVNVDTVMAYAIDNGFITFRVGLPTSAEGVYTVSADTMSSDVTDARKDRTVHLDQYTGKKLADVGWQDYSLAAKGMAAGIALHMGEMGGWNIAANVLFCLAMIFISVSGVVMWWLRRPQGVFRLGAPPMPKDLPLWEGAVFIMLLVSLAFPLSGIALLLVLALDLLILSRIPALKHVFN